MARVASGQRAGRSKRCLSGFDTVYTLRGGPILRPSGENQREVLRVMFASILAERPRWDAISLKLLDRDSPVFDYIVEELRVAGMFVEPYFQYGNWYEELTGRSFDAYVADRGKTVRETLRWKYRRLMRTGSVCIALVTDEVGLEKAIEAYRTVYAASWKPPEQYPNFIERLIRDCATGGYLRLGNLYLDGQPVATQLNMQRLHWRGYSRLHPQWRTSGRTPLPRKVECPLLFRGGRFERGPSDLTLFRNCDLHHPTGVTGQPTH